MDGFIGAGKRASDGKTKSDCGAAFGRRQALQTGHADGKSKGRWQKRWSRETVDGPVGIAELDLQRTLDRHKVARPKHVQEPKRRVVASHHQVLTIVDLVTTPFVSEGSCPPPKVGAGLQQKGSKAVVGKAACGGDA